MTRPAASRLLATGLLLVLAAAAALLLRADAGAAPTQSQAFFRTKLLEDARTSKTIRDLLRSGGGFVDGSIAFRDLTGDKKLDAVVRVQSNTSAGAVAFYVFSADGTDSEENELRAIYRQQALRRAFTRVQRNVLSFRSAAYAPGDEVCCPSETVETTLRWDRRAERFVVAKRTNLGPAATPTPGPTVSPEASPTATPAR